MWPRRLPSKTAAAEWSTEGRIRRTLACRRRRGVERSVNAGDHNVTFFKTVEDLGRRAVADAGFHRHRFENRLRFALFFFE